MPPKKNPLKLNALQLKTLTLFQELARNPETSTRIEQTGEVAITAMPHPHGDHFHVGKAVVLSRDATGLANPAVWNALERKGLARSARRGKRVTQGQIIGYVGTTGRSTGPHLHYEILVGGRRINPMKVKMPSGRKLKGEELESFQVARTLTDDKFRALTPERKVADASRK